MWLLILKRNLTKSTIRRGMWLWGETLEVTWHTRPSISSISTSGKWRFCSSRAGKEPLGSLEFCFVFLRQRCCVTKWQPSQQYLHCTAFDVIYVWMWWQTTFGRWTAVYSKVLIVSRGFLLLVMDCYLPFYGFGSSKRIQVVPGAVSKCTVLVAMYFLLLLAFFFVLPGLLDAHTPCKRKTESMRAPTFCGADNINLLMRNEGWLWSATVLLACFNTVLLDYECAGSQFWIMHVNWSKATSILVAGTRKEQVAPFALHAYINFQNKKWWTMNKMENT